VVSTDWDVAPPQYELGKITTSGRISYTRFDQSIDAGSTLVLGADGNLWFLNTQLLTDGSESIARLSL
jgi:hypothetical protein